MNLIWLAVIPLAPLLASGLIYFLPSTTRRWASGLALGALTLSFFLSCMALRLVFNLTGPATVNFVWFPVGTEAMTLGLILDPLSAVMAVMVTLVSLLIFIYSTAYMEHDPGYGRFFGYLSLFVAGMLGIIVSNHLLLTFMCWELVGVASYLLIGFWFTKPAAAAAAKKAFITTRIADIGFLLGMIWLYRETNTLLFYAGGEGLLESALTSLALKASGWGSLSVAGAVALLIFCGAAGKSGQWPFHVWLPDAMEGPTPVSALIHAATMVAAGVFLVARLFDLFAVDPIALQVVGGVGLFTALLAATMALTEWDIKRILAFSTVSQLGFMMFGLAWGGPGVGMFHLLTHAFFKALLFLGAGSLIHGCHGEQDIRKMGGLAARMPLTAAAYALGTLALCGFPFTAGYYSKEEILEATYRHSPGLFAVAALTVFLTSFYMARQCCYVFGKTYRGEEEPHESPSVMTYPLILLSLFAVGAGYVGHRWGLVEWLTGRELEHGAFPLVTIASWIMALGGLTAGWWVYRLQTTQEPLEAKLGILWAGARARWGWDELYERTLGRSYQRLAVWVDVLELVQRVLVELGVLVVKLLGAKWGTVWDGRWLNEKFFDATCRDLRSGGASVSRMQSGFLPSYLRYLAAGAIALAILWKWIEGHG
jgi:NADH-quinone oxidoreductase subunit L